MRVELQKFDRYGGNNERGKNIAVIINGIEVLNIWNNGEISAPVESPAYPLNARWEKVKDGVACVGAGARRRGRAHTRTRVVKEKPSCLRCRYLHQWDGNCERYVRIGNRPCKEFVEGGKA